MTSDPSAAASDFQHTGEHLLLALYDGGRLWFRSPFDDANALGDAAEAFAEGHIIRPDTSPAPVLHLAINGHIIEFVHGPTILWENLIGALDLSTRTMPGRDPEEVWILPTHTDRILEVLAGARIL